MNVESLVAASLPIDSVNNFYSQFDDTAKKNTPCLYSILRKPENGK
jgi:hypothetical protein